MDFSQLIALIAPLAVVMITQGLKQFVSSRWAPLIVIGLGGSIALLEQGMSPDPVWIDGVVTTGWVSGLATLIYDFFKKTVAKR